MTCRETETLDLAAFLARGAAPEFAAFRAHYPRCADCAAEVRAWTELHAALSAPSHPSPESLLRYEDGRLAEADRGAVRRHLEACAPCRDEIRALGAFDRGNARVTRPAAVQPRPWFRLPSWGRLVMHPALAYGLVLALLFYPSLRGREPEPQRVRVDDAPAQKSAGRAERSDDGESAREERAAPAEQQVAEAPQRMYRQKRAPEAPPPAADSRAKADAVARESDAAPLAALGKVAGGGGRDVALLLQRGTTVRLDLRNAGAHVTLRIPVVSGTSRTEVRVIDDGEERELRERRAAEGDYIDLQVPTTWLHEGRYRVETHGAGGAETFDFEVGP